MNDATVIWTFYRLNAIFVEHACVYECVIVFAFIAFNSNSVDDSYERSERCTIWLQCTAGVTNVVYVYTWLFVRMVFNGTSALHGLCRMWPPELSWCCLVLGRQQTCCSFWLVQHGAAFHSPTLGHGRPITLNLFTTYYPLEKFIILGLELGRKWLFTAHLRGF